MFFLLMRIILFLSLVRTMFSVLVLLSRVGMQIHSIIPTTLTLVLKIGS